MSRKRTFTVHVNIDDMTAMLAGLDGPSEKSDWLDGYMVGVHGHPSRETWSQPKRMGYDFGAKHFAEVEEFRAEQKRKSDLAEAAKNAQKYPEGTHGLPTGTGSGNPAGDPIQQSNNPLIQETIKPTNEQPKRTRQAAFIPPSEAEWVAYCTSTWPDWSAITSAESWAYYEALRPPWKGFSDWRKVARTAHGKARDWGQLQPKGSNPQAQKPDWVIRKLAELQQKLDSAERQLRRDIADKGVDSHSAGLSRKQIESIKEEMGAL